MLFGLFGLHLMEPENEDAGFGMDGLAGGTGCGFVWKMGVMGFRILWVCGLFVC